MRNDAAMIPADYRAACEAIAVSTSASYCRTIADSMVAEIAEAQQFCDHGRRARATRIRLRALRRIGELLAEFDAQGQRSDKLLQGDQKRLTQAEAAEQAGLRPSSLRDLTCDRRSHGCPR